MTLLQAVRILIRWWRPILCLPLIAAVAAAAVTGRRPAQFRSTGTLYTGIASGYHIESGQVGRADYQSISTAFDNLINLTRSRRTLESVGLRLLAEDLAAGAREAVEAWPFFRAASIDDSFGRQGDDPDPDAVHARLLEASEAGDPEIHRLMSDPASIYSARVIERALESKRVGSSDMLSLAYTATDPTMARRTLTILIDELSLQYRDIKDRETAAVIAYFEAATAGALDRLQAAVEEVREFGVENRVINYYEQTKYIASEKEAIDRELQQERMRLSAADAALAEVQEKLELRQDLMVRSSAVTEARRELASLTAQRTLGEARGSADQSLDQRISDLSDQLSAEIEGLYQLTHSREGLAREDLSREWLENFIATNESRARLEVLERRREEYARTYDVFAPLGSGLSSLEREVDIAENEYLEMLHSLNQARMREQNVAMASRLAIVDPPTLPTEPQSSKRLQLVLLSAIATGILALSLVFATELLDQTLRSPTRAEEVTGLKLAGAFPPDTIGHPLLRALDAHLERNLRLALDRRSGRGQGPRRTLVVASVVQGDGSSGVATRSRNLLSAGGMSSAMLSPEPDADADSIPYPVGFASSQRTAAELAGDRSDEVASVDLVVVEVPGILRNPLPIQVIRDADAVLLAVRSDRAWEDSDRTALAVLNEASRVPPELVLSNTGDEGLESVVGEIPRPRSAVRRLAKRIAKLELLR